MARMRLVAQPKEGERYTREADAELLQRPAPGDGLRHSFCQLIELVVHNFPFVLVFWFQFAVVVEVLALNSPKFIPATFCPLRAAMGLGLAVVCVQLARGTTRAEYVPGPSDVIW